VRVAIADDSTLFRGGLSLLLASAAVEVVVQVASGRELEVEVSERDLDAVILDIRMPPSYTDEGLQTAKHLRRMRPDLAILVLSTYAETAYALQILDIGEQSMGYLLKDRVSDTATLLDALERLQRGETVIDPDIVQRLLRRQRTTTKMSRLTEREREVLQLMAEGRSNVAIARRLGVHTKTVEHYISALFAHLGLADSADDNRRVLATLTWLRSEV
jgi:DNA-binding NarL/FixJ family response regulator